MAHCPQHSLISALSAGAIVALMTEEGALEVERKKFEAQRAQHAATAFGSATAFASSGAYGSISGGAGGFGGNGGPVGGLGSVSAGAGPSLPPTANGVRSL